MKSCKLCGFERPFVMYHNQWAAVCNACRSVERMWRSHGEALSAYLVNRMEECRARELGEHRKYRRYSQALVHFERIEKDLRKRNGKPVVNYP